MLVINLVMNTVLSLTGCPKADRMPQETPIERALYAAKTSTAKAQYKGESLSEKQKVYRVRLRHNTGRCEAPDYEIFAYGRWTRLFLEVDEGSTRDFIEAFATDQRKPSTLKSTLWVQGNWSDESYTSPRGVSWPIFSVVALDRATTMEPNTRTKSSQPQRIVLWAHQGTPCAPYTSLGPTP